MDLTGMYDNVKQHKSSYRFETLVKLGDYAVWTRRFPKRKRIDRIFSHFFYFCGTFKNQTLHIRNPRHGHEEFPHVAGIGRVTNLTKKTLMMAHKCGSNLIPVGSRNRTTFHRSDLLAQGHSLLFTFKSCVTAERVFSP